MSGVFQPFLFVSDFELAISHRALRHRHPRPRPRRPHSLPFASFCCNTIYTTRFSAPLRFLFFTINSHRTCQLILLPLINFFFHSGARITPASSLKRPYIIFTSHNGSSFTFWSFVLCHTYPLLDRISEGTQNKGYSVSVFRVGDC